MAYSQEHKKKSYVFWWICVFDFSSNIFDDIFPAVALFSSYKNGSRGVFGDGVVLSVVVIGALKILRVFNMFSAPYPSLSASALHFLLQWQNCSTRLLTTPRRITPRRTDKFWILFCITLGNWEKSCQSIEKKVGDHRFYFCLQH